MPRGVIDPGISGLAVTYGLNLNMLLAQVIQNLCELENTIISVERILQYMAIDSEPPLSIESNILDTNWPSIGEIKLHNLQVRYRQNMPLVLRGLTFTFPGGMKTGIVGRTGSGKSTLIQALFRIIDPTVGETISIKQEVFRINVPIPPGQVCAINDALSAPGAAEDYETALKHLVNIGVVVKSATGYPRFDLMLLGMGPDGHIASLFPSHPLLNVTDKWVTFIKDSPKPPPERITFTLPVINSSSYVAMVVAGAGKAGVVGKALGNEKTADLLPVEMISLEDGELTWFADNAAVSMLPDKPSL